MNTISHDNLLSQIRTMGQELRSPESPAQPARIGKQARFKAPNFRV